MPVTVGPSGPTESSTAVPAGGFSTWFKNIIDWIKSLSPAGATQYDTDWTNITLASGLSVNTSTPQWRRIGKVAYFRGAIRPTSGNFAANTTYTLTEAIPGVGTNGGFDAVKTAYGPSGSGPVRMWLQGGTIQLYVPSGVTPSYVTLAALSGTPVD